MSQLMFESRTNIIISGHCSCDIERCRSILRYSERESRQLQQRFIVICVLHCNCHLQRPVGTSVYHALNDPALTVAYAVLPMVEIALTGRV